MLHLQRPLKADTLIEESGWLGRDYNGVPLVASMDLLENAKSAVAAAPLKYSPQDAQGARRRQREDAGSDEWIESLPTPRKEEDE